MKKSIEILIIFFLFGLFINGFAQKYKNFEVAVYCPVNVVEKLADEKLLSKSFQYITKNLHVDKIYLETHRHHDLMSAEIIEKEKSFFERNGVNVAGGITTTGDKSNGLHMRVYCYTNPETEKHLKKVVEFTAKHFNEIILDDFYFTSCRCDRCIKQKGDRSWSGFRTKLMTDFSKNVMIKSAKKVNPNLKFVIKYPNWYEFYQFNGYDLKNESSLFDGIYTGTETRDPNFTHQNLQPYQSYLIMRYLENVAPGKNGGGWLDPLSKGNMERYGEQIELTLFAKAKEVTLFNYGSLFEELPDGNITGTIAPYAASVFRKADSFLAELGNPVGIVAYRPFNSTGEAFLHNYFGMIGIPIELTPYFPNNAKTLLLTSHAACDKNIISKIKDFLQKGNHLILTSGFVKKMQGKGIDEIISVRVNGNKFLSNEFTDLSFKDIAKSQKEILFPQIDYATNDSWKEIAALADGNSFPVLIRSAYSKGEVTVLAIPDNFADLYNLPRETLLEIRNYLTEEFPVKIDAPSQVALFLYDNNTLIVHSFLPHTTSVKIINKKNKRFVIENLLTKKEREIDYGFYSFVLPSHSYKVFRIK